MLTSSVTCTVSTFSHKYAETFGICRYMENKVFTQTLALQCVELEHATRMREITNAYENLTVKLNHR